MSKINNRQSKDSTNQHQYLHKPRIWQVDQVFHRIDRFALDVPAFNIKGDRKVSTLAGGTLTFALMCLVMLFASVKFEEMY